jgi:hypothetical protein
MSPREIESLQEIAKATGGNLTVNPKTGLPEAGWLDAILPVVAGGIAAVMSGGTLIPVLAGAATGALTGDKDQSLLMRAGLGALGGFGGSGIASSLGSMGANAGAQAGLVSAGEAAATAGGAGTAAGEAAAMEAVRTAATTSPLQNIAAGAQQLGTQGGPQAFMAGMPFGKYGLAAAAAPGISEAMKPPKMAGVEESDSPTYYIGANGQPITYDPYTERYSAGMYSKSYPGIGMAEGGQVPQASGLFSFNPPQQDQQQPQQPQQVGYPFTAGTSAQASPQQQPPPQAIAQSSPQTYRYGPGPTPAPVMNNGMAEGGEVKSGMTMPEMQQYYRSLLTPARATAVPPSSDALLNYMNRINQSVVEAPMPPRPTPPPSTGQAPAATAPLTYQTKVGKKSVTRSLPAYAYDPATQRFTQTAAGDMGMGTSAAMPSYNGIFGDLVKYASGGMTYAAGGKLLGGAGDGMSDSIPAVIEGGQKAALSQGEFVIPADVVSHVGNGSTDAGAKRFYEMMDRIRQARTGKKSQAPAINPGKYLNMA